MGKNNDLDIQTFQIYQDDETNESKTETKEQPKKKKFDFSFKRKEKVEKTATPVDAADDDEDEGSSKKGMNEIVKGLLIGFAVLAVFIIIDMVRK